MNTETETILGYEVFSSPAQSLFDVLETGLDDRRPCRWLACLNPHSYVTALHDVHFRQALESADWLIPDGAGILIASRSTSGKIKQRITGWDVFVGLNQRLDHRGGGRIFLIGSSENTLAKLRARIAQDYPNVSVVGTYSPPFRASYTEAETETMINTVNASNANILWVAMTAPKQEKWIHDNVSRLNVDLAFAVGAVFDFYAGNVKRSSPIFRRLGLEWLPRLVQEPRRLWRRTFVSAPVFLGHMLYHHLFGRSLR